MSMRESTEIKFDTMTGEESSFDASAKVNS